MRERCFCLFVLYFTFKQTHYHKCFIANTCSKWAGVNLKQNAQLRDGQTHLLNFIEKTLPLLQQAQLELGGNVVAILDRYQGSVCCACNHTITTLFSSRIDILPYRVMSE